MKRSLRVTLLSIAMLLVGASSAMAATTFGALAGDYGGGACSTDCSWFQISSSPNSYTVPHDGVITKIEMRTGSDPELDDDNVEFFTTRELSAGNYQLVNRSGLMSFAGKAAESDAAFSVRAPVKTGDFIGITGTFSSVSPATLEFVAGDKVVNATITGLSPGQMITPIGINVFNLNLRATLEPDGDGDGFGDETQDLCPSQAFPAGGPCDTAAPVITQFKTAYKRWRYARKGLVVAKRAHPGTTISFNMSEPAIVNFQVIKEFRGKITKGVCKKIGRTNRKNRRCTKLILVHSFSRGANTGVNSFPYSARYRDAKNRVGTLRPGPYRMTATPVDSFGNTGVTDILSFTITR